ncbi:hypothetical protein Taro_000835 [Colocasia esculenta]|uniref:Uncharacterized protein n=1 Tax=Colocasia esculenta TaxID=4460 RepID=A0A843TEB6_COLES|nr:hypothetical protein [Colocasia esculenta]
MVDRALVSRNSVSEPKFCSGACVLHRFSYPFGRTRIFVRQATGTARDDPIRNGHFDPVGTNSYRNRLCGHNSESTLRDGRQGAGFTEFRFGAKIM